MPENTFTFPLIAPSRGGRMADTVMVSIPERVTQDPPGEPERVTQDPPGETATFVELSREMTAALRKGEVITHTQVEEIRIGPHQTPARHYVSGIKHDLRFESLTPNELNLILRALFEYRDAGDRPPVNHAEHYTRTEIRAIELGD